MPSDPQYWFPAKQHGWGWGLPIAWQGWVVLAAFVALVAAGAFLLPPRKMLVPYLVYIGVLAALFIGICWLKGEPPLWRWG